MYIFKQEKSKDETTIFIVRKRKEKIESWKDPRSVYQTNV